MPNPSGILLKVKNTKFNVISYEITNHVLASLPNEVYTNAIFEIFKRMMKNLLSYNRGNTSTLSNVDVLKYDELISIFDNMEKPKSTRKLRAIDV